MKNQFSILTLLALLLLLPPFANAQFGDYDNVDDVPIDGGLSLLVAAGIGYGARKMKKKQSQTKSLHRHQQLTYMEGL